MVIPVWGQELSGQPRADPGLLGISSDEQHCTPPFLLRLQGLLTLFTEFFASFVHYFCTIGSRSVCLLAMDTHRTSNCSPKPL